MFPRRVVADVSLTAEQGHSVERQLVAAADVRLEGNVHVRGAVQPEGQVTGAGDPQFAPRQVRVRSDGPVAVGLPTGPRGRSMLKDDVRRAVAVAEVEAVALTEVAVDVVLPLRHQRQTDRRVPAAVAPVLDLGNERASDGGRHARMPRPSVRAERCLLDDRPVRRPRPAVVRQAGHGRPVEVRHLGPRHPATARTANFNPNRTWRCTIIVDIG